MTGLAKSNDRSTGRKKIAYFHDEDVGAFDYHSAHPMKPYRLAVTHSLIESYGLTGHMDVFRPRRASRLDFARYHTSEYVNFLSIVNNGELPYVGKDLVPLHKFFNISEDCPVFKGIFDYCAIYAGGSLEASRLLNSGSHNIAINWSGGLHHAKKDQASGFCYVNDIVLAILELLRYHQRVLYIDIDVHHGDGVQDAFYNCDRVMTVSLHRYGSDFFPQTGHLNEIGRDDGKYYSINVPLRSGITDDNYFNLAFKPVIDRVMSVFQPSVIVLQCGADSLAGDKLGPFSLTIKGHGRCVEYVKAFHLPLLVLGGGGYTVSNVARCWTYETALLVGKQLPAMLPDTEYREVFGSDISLIPVMSKKDDLNTLTYLDSVVRSVHERLRNLAHAPSVQMSESPESLPGEEEVAVEEEAFRSSTPESFEY
ncbi:hypothetical protein RvY_10869 [Ramazzottius varieornatus]|uniref:Histone deacetylase n=1 Tax=Ramazzottius varieornatus TaxID=947166 RepID=A0A1D1VN53_RAMVA|nr:hypothetical protein RvY_10869 [Ramazzottius varieornatus]